VIGSLWVAVIGLGLARAALATGRPNPPCRSLAPQVGRRGQRSRYRDQCSGPFDPKFGRHADRSGRLDLRSSDPKVTAFDLRVLAYDPQVPRSAFRVVARATRLTARG
jgi:hypothetical protein